MDKLKTAKEWMASQNMPTGGFAITGNIHVLMDAYGKYVALETKQLAINHLRDMLAENKVELTQFITRLIEP